MSTVVTLRRKWSKVEHLGFWAYDRVSTNPNWPTGRYVPLCGQERNHEVHWEITDHGSADDDQTKLDLLHPLCSRCLTLARWLAKLFDTEERS